MSDITGFFSYLKVMLWLAQDLFSNCTQTGTALVSSTAGIVQVMVLSLRLREDTRAELGDTGAAAWPEHPLTGRWQPQMTSCFQSHGSQLFLQAADSSSQLPPSCSGAVPCRQRGAQCQHAVVPHQSSA